MKSEDFDWAIHTIPIWAPKFKIKKIPTWLTQQTRFAKMRDVKKGEEGLYYGGSIWLTNGTQFPAHASLLEFVRHVPVRRSYDNVPIKEIR